MQTGYLGNGEAGAVLVRGRNLTPENTQKLYEAFPRLYRGQSKIIYESSMCLGFVCDDGWFDLIWNLSQAIEDIARNEGLEPQSDDWPEATQVKEKFGTLCFRLKRRAEATTALIRKAEAASATTCEICGAPGSQDANLRSGVKTVCGDHAEDILRETLVTLHQF